MSKLPKLSRLGIAPPKFMVAGKDQSGLGTPGEDRLIIDMQAKFASDLDPSVTGVHEATFSFSLPVEEAANPATLELLQPLAYESAAELLEAIASELRKIVDQ